MAEKLRVLDLFSGIGGFSLGLERAKHDGAINGFETVAFCEIEAFPRKVLAKHWPDVPCYDDVRTLTAERLAADGVGPVGVITGGFPCQDLSAAGQRAPPKSLGDRLYVQIRNGIVSKEPWPVATTRWKWSWNEDGTCNEHPGDVVAIRRAD